MHDYPKDSLGQSRKNSSIMIPGIFARFHRGFVRLTEAVAPQWHQKLARTPQGPCTTCRHGRQSMNPKTRQYPPKTLRDGPGILQTYRPKTLQEFINDLSKDCHDSPKDFPRLGQFPKAVFRDCPQECSRSLHDFPSHGPRIPQDCPQEFAKIIQGQCMTFQAMAQGLAQELDLTPGQASPRFP